jgi:HEAT repeat protein
LCVTVILSLRVFSEDEKTVEKLIKQFQGEAYYWNNSGEKIGFFDRWTTRSFEERCKITAARFLGEMRTRAKEAVPILIEALKTGPNDIDTGDGILPYRSTIAIALGKIGDPRAIHPLIEKLKWKEKATISSGAAFPKNWKFPVGIGHLAIVEALGMFGGQAKEAISYLEALLQDAQDKRLKEAIENALKKIKDK